MNLPIKKFFYDVETTGLNFRRCSIHQLSFYIEIDGEIVETHNMKLRPHPDAEVTQEALNICGVTLEEIQTYPDYKEQFQVLHGILSKYVDKYNNRDKFYMIGFKNATFDDDFLRKLFELNGYMFYLYFYINTIDVSCLASQYLLDQRQRMPSFKLQRVAKVLGLQVDKSRLHDAMYDVELTRGVYRIVTGLEKENLL